MQQDDIYGRLADALESDWATLARPNQLPPAGDWWRIWLLLAGRGFGKTRTINEFVRGEVERGTAARIAIVAATASDYREVLVEGPAGLLAISPSWNKPTWEPTKRRLTWRNGAIASCFSADEPDRLRGPQHDLAICDELAAWRYPDAFEMLLLGLRSGLARVAIATTPRPTKIIRDLIAREGKDVVITRGSTLENAANLAPAYIDQILERYRGTRLERQEVFGEVLEDTPGALWTRENLELTRVADAPQMQRVVVAIDPAGSSEEGADMTGIVVAGLGQDGHGYVLDDLSGRYAPTDWARRALGAFHVWKADRIVCETNYGGEMVAATIAAVDPNVPVKTITSSRGKVLRAEPIAAFFEQRRAHIVGSQPELEDQACRFTADWSRARDGSPDRVDALVFALTELLLVAPPGGFIKEASLLPHPAADGSVRAPIEVPAEVFAVFAAAAAGVGPEPDALGVIYFGLSVTPATFRNPPLVILDWDLTEIGADTLDRWFAAVFRRLKELARATRAMGSAGLTLEPSGIGETLCLQAAMRYGDYVIPVRDPKILSMTPAQRAVAASGHVHSGHVQITRPAHEKLVTFQGALRNHLIHQVVAFGVGQQPTEAGVLLTAFSNAVVEIFKDPSVQHHISLLAS